jgi:hypothetical protein
MLLANTGLREFLVNTLTDEGKKGPRNYEHTECYSAEWALII